MTRHPNTPASRNEEAVETMSKMEVEAWRRALLAWRDTSPTELSDNPAGLKKCLSVAAQLLLDHPTLAAPASRTEQAAPSVASGAVVDVRRLAAEARANPGIEIALSEGTANAFRDALAAPGAAIAAREQDIPDVMVDAYLKAQRETVERVDREWGGKTGKAAEHLQPVREACRNGLRAALASRQEAPAASASPATVAQPVAAGASRKSAKAAAEYEVREWMGENDVVLKSPAYRALITLVLAAQSAAQPCPTQGCGGDGGEVLPAMPDLRYHPEYRRGFANCLSEIQRMRACSTDNSNGHGGSKE